MSETSLEVASPRVVPLPECPELIKKLGHFLRLPMIGISSGGVGRKQVLKFS
jgi:hypothetical protein